MNLSSIHDLISLAQTRHELGHVIGSIDRGEPIIISSLESEGHMLVPADKLPAGFENALRALAEELDTQMKGMGVDPDMPLIPEVEIDENDSEDDEQ
jgi:hypothetical protein